MALSLAEYRTRIDNELNLLGSFQESTKDNFIKDALTQFCRAVEPEISANLSIIVGTTSYSVPATIEKITGIFDSSRNRIVYTLDEYAKKIYLQDSVSSSTTYTVYGTPASIRTNYSAVITALNENYGDCLWHFIQFVVHDASNSDQTSNMYMKARNTVKELRQDRNRNPDSYKQMIQLKDIQGNMIDDIYNADNINPDIDDLFEVRL